MNSLPISKTIELKDAGYSADITLPEDADADGLAYCRELWSE